MAQNTFLMCDETNLPSLRAPKMLTGIVPLPRLPYTEPG